MIVLFNCRSHVFATFFKVFFLVVVFGLYNGLFVLPVVLSFLGPAAYSAGEQEEGKLETLDKEEEEPFRYLLPATNLNFIDWNDPRFCSVI